MPEDLKPFHESIVGALYQAPRAYLQCLGRLIMATKIPKNHDQILEAWNTATTDCNFTNELRNLPENLMRQKALANQHKEAPTEVRQLAPADA